MERTTIFPPDRVTIVAVLNVTPDSFSDGGRLVTGESGVKVEAAVDLAAELVEGGAHVLDVGGESTRPGAREVATGLEVERTAPVVEALAKRFGVPISIDTRKATVAQAALDAGADVVNDVSGLAHDPELGAVAARRGAALILGHMRGTPETMQRAPHFEDPVAEVASELEASVAAAVARGVGQERICVDPGIGFGKNLEHNLKLLAGVGALRERVGLPVLVGPSRKAFLGLLTGDPVEARDPASWAACAVAAFAGADAVRVHSVPGALRAVRVGRALREGHA
ncbi:MAG: dihydropteroate synthase [Myxococcota bacterium]|nr:dihydropteroate synthase [Myxococcota bacterium]